MRNIVRAAAAAMVFLAIVGCGGGEQPAKVEKPAEPAFVAEVSTVDSSMVASIAKMGPYADYGKTLAELVAAVQAAKLSPVDGPFGVYYDNPAQVKPESAKYEVCLKVAPETKAVKLDAKTGFSVKKMPAAMVATTMHVGPYDKVGPTYAKLIAWTAENKYEAAGPMIEWYISDPTKVPAESLQTRVGVVVKPAAPPADTTKKAEEPKKEEGKPAATGK
jgi:effector-binding domain-containing protein